MPRYLRESLKRTIDGRSKLNKRRIIQNVLSFEFRDSLKAKWWLANETFVPIAESTTDAVRSIRNDIIPSHVKILKRSIFAQTERKNVFSINHSESPETSFVSKVFFLVHLSHKLNYRLYGLCEAANSIEAARRGICTSRVYGYGHMYNTFGLVEASVIIFEHLRNAATVSELMSSGKGDEREKLFMQTIPLFVNLYRAGCHHIDVNSSAVMLSDHEVNPKVFLIDFHHAKFYSRPSTEILMFEMGYFARSCSNFITTQIIDGWMDSILAAINIKSSSEIQKMRHRFNYYFDVDLSRKERKKIR
jgi:tRNA A-37 threonylcarbamoyl transferase component Bud32